MRCEDGDCAVVVSIIVAFSQKSHMYKYVRGGRRGSCTYQLLLEILQCAVGIH